MKRKLVLIILIIIFVFSLNGCWKSDYDKLYETDYFVCINREDYVNILELTEKGIEQEVLLISDYINGIKVKVVGGGISNKLGPEPYRYIKSDNLKKIYFGNYNKNIGYISHSKDYLKIVMPTQDNSIANFYNNINDKNIYFITDISKEYKDVGWEKTIDYNNIKFLDVNIIYYTNAEEDPYWWDYIGEGELYLKPKNPTKQGCQFDGWYLDPKYKNVWNGKYEVAEGEKIKLYAKWI